MIGGGANERTNGVKFVGNFVARYGKGEGSKGQSGLRAPARGLKGGKTTLQRSSKRLASWGGGGSFVRRWISLISSLIHFLCREEMPSSIP